MGIFRQLWEEATRSKENLFEGREFIEDELKKIDPEAKIQNKNGAVAVVHTSLSRLKFKDEFQKVLSKLYKEKKIIDYTEASMSSVSNTIDVDVITFPDKSVLKIGYKDAAKGSKLSHTFSAAITELIPCALFQYGLDGKKGGADKLMSALIKEARDKGTIKVDNWKVILPQDVKKAEETINKIVDLYIDKNSRVMEKLENAEAISIFLKEEPGFKGYTNIIWGNAAKPEGISPKHKGDVFLKYKDGYKGISLKAGKKSDKEPLHNGSVWSMYSELGRTKAYYDMVDEVWEKSIYPCLKDEPDWENIKKEDVIAKTKAEGIQYKKGWQEKIYEFEKKHENEYQKLWELGQSINRDHIIKMFETIKYPKLKEFFIETFIAESDDCPLYIVKATGNKAYFKEDPATLKQIMGLGDKIKGTTSSKAKATFYINVLKGSEKQGFLEMHIRTTKAGKGHKVGMMLNLAVKYIESTYVG